MQPPVILSHRACLTGPCPADENSPAALARAVAHGYGVEFDVNREPGGARLVLTHDPAPWSAERDATRFLRDPGSGPRHALNVKDLDVVDAIADELDAAGTADRFFLFDFELLEPDRAASRRRIRALQERGLEVAHRVSEDEPFLDEYLADPTVTTLWLDEWRTPWVGAEHLLALAEAGKATYYVSPDLHGRRDLDALQRRWAVVAGWGATGICTDYPHALAELLGGTQ